MPIGSNGRIGEQHAAYRKGLVLGLTMAEVGILIIFVLLLLLAFEHLRRNQLVGRFQGAVAVEASRLQQLNEAEETLQQIALTLGVAETDPPEDFTHLVRVLQAAMADRQARSALDEAKKVIAEMREAVKQVKTVAETAETGSAEAIAKQVRAQSYRIANQEGQLKRYEEQLVAAGQGKGERPCWVQPDGRIDYLYEVVLASEGIRMRELEHPHRVAERELLPMPQADPNETLSPAEFLRRTAPLYSYSLTANCRFFVVVYDATAAHEKALYKSLLRTVEGHFYKRLSEAAAPF